MYKKILNIVIFLFLVLGAHCASAASVSVELPRVVNIGETFEIMINADTDGTLVNSASVKLKYDKDKLSFAGYKTENTIMNLWVEAPKDADGVVSFSGIIPGGVFGLFDPDKQELSAIPVTRLIFIAKSTGEIKFELLETEILRHDGRGSPLLHDKIDASLIIGGNSNDKVENKVFDTENPEPFEIKLVESGFFSRTPSMIIWSTTDRISGIKEYQIRMRGLGWRTVVSPHPVVRSIFTDTLVIRAYDYAGNFTEGSIKIPGLIPLYIILPLGLILLCFVGIKVLKLKA